MRVQFQRLTNGNEHVLKLIFNECCPRANDAWQKELIGFGDINEVRNDINAVCIYQLTVDSDQYSIYEIAFCPFCRAAVQIEEVEIN